MLYSVNDSRQPAAAPAAASSFKQGPATSTLTSTLRQLIDLLQEDKNVVLDGQSLNLSSAFAVGRYVVPTYDPVLCGVTY